MRAGRIGHPGFRGLVTVLSLTSCLAFSVAAQDAAVERDDRRETDEDGAQRLTYPIKLVRPPKVGQRYTITAEGAMLRNAVFRINGRKADETEEGFGVQLEGTVEVLGVNKDGEEAKVACAVKRCVRITPDGEQPLVPAGRVVTATGGKEKTEFALDEGKLSEEAAEALEVVLSMGEEDGFNDDRIYGTRQRQPVGRAWEMDRNAAAEEAGDEGVRFELRDVSGSLKIERIETVNGLECLRIGGVTEIKRFTAQAPPDMKFERGSLKARYWGLYPTDAALPTQGESSSVIYKATYTGTNRDGDEVTIDSRVQRAVEMKRTFTK